MKMYILDNVSYENIYLKCQGYSEDQLSFGKSYSSEDQLSSGEVVTSLGCM